MIFIKLLPIIFSSLLLSAHFMRAELLPLVLLSLFLPFLLLVKRPWAARFIQIVLIAGSFEWVRTVIVLVAMRRDAGEPWLRMVLILGSVATFTLLSAVTIEGKTLRERYKLTRKSEYGKINSKETCNE